MTLHHFVLKFKDDGTANIYMDANGHLMMVEAPTLAIKQIRTGFVLDK